MQLSDCENVASEEATLKILDSSVIAVPFLYSAKSNGTTHSVLNGRILDSMVHLNSESADATFLVILLMKAVCTSAEIFSKDPK